MTSPSDFSDIRSDTWIDRYAPPGTRPYLTLMRLDRPIGTWLLLLPCWWGLALAPRPTGFAWSDLALAGLFAVGSIVMRGAGCVINDIIDRDLDAQVARTRTRPIPSGAVSVVQAGMFLAALLLAGLAILVQFNAFTIWLGMASLALVFPYPAMKRITWWPQAFLGLTFNWGALLGWTAITGSLDWAPVILYAAGVFWTLGYDTVYAHQDTQDDARIGVRSSARRLGAASKPWVIGFYAITALLLCLAGVAAQLHPLFFAGLCAAFTWQMVQMSSWRMNDPADCLRRFKAEKWSGFLVLSGLLLGQVLA